MLGLPGDGSPLPVPPHAASLLHQAIKLAGGPSPATCTGGGTPHPFGNIRLLGLVEMRVAPVFYSDALVAPQSPRATAAMAVGQDWEMLAW